MIVSYLPDPERHPLWEGIRALLEKATIGGVPAWDGELVWIAYEGPLVFAAATSAMVNDEVAEVRCISGAKMRLWLGELDGAVSAWARSCGAKKLITRGRMGWARYARAFGWDALGTDEDGLRIYEKELPE